MLTVAFTGHRPKDLYGYGSPKWAELRDRLATYLTKLAEANNGLTVITGGAQGVDMTAFWATQQAKNLTSVPVINNVYVPHVGQESRWRVFGEFGQEDYNDMLKCADNIHRPDHTPKDTKEIITMLLKRNEDMVNDADVLIAVTNQDVKHPNSKGGTAAAIRYANKVGKPVIQFRP